MPRIPRLRPRRRAQRLVCRRRLRRSPRHRPSDLDLQCVDAQARRLVAVDIDRRRLLLMGEERLGGDVFGALGEGEDLAGSSSGMKPLGITGGRRLPETLA
ncbi:MAG TPA: hypothetical protein VHR45_18165 [Thermoanaerobaculia bacterium]|nr:hypothetical protein [Thermoanaerobaculia bacterium]